MNYQYKNNLVGAMIVAGWDEREGGQVWCVPISGTLVQVGAAGAGWVVMRCVCVCGGRVGGGVGVGVGGISALHFRIAGGSVHW